MMKRRDFLAGSAALTSAPWIIPARASDDRIVMACWGGGTARMWRDAFGKPFTADTKIPVTVAEVPDPSAAIAAAQGRPQHNVIIAASFQGASLARRGLIEEFDASELPNLKHIPEKYWIKNEAGKVLGMPIYFIYYGVAYNTKSSKADDFASWKNLAEPKWKGLLSITRPIFFAPYDLTICSKVMGGNEVNIEPGIPLLQGIARNAVSSYTSMASLQQQLALGEVSAAPFYSSQVQLLRRSGEKGVDIVIPQEGGLVLSYILAIPKNSGSRAAAIRFLNESISPPKQIEAARNAYLPLSNNVELPADLSKDYGMTMDEVRGRNWAPDWYAVAGQIEERMRLVQRIIDEAR
ncbi:extracellular solute-binding protein [Enterovirga rhinocerotis]|uniref:Putative spermidine/putrescine transport system substrate-binding protein n=1 Tax=Enterovirga rhinocerotis TaxID=1339210 RepID=A0A4R7BXB2_9HYPH|nr:extracellular solute-binding protein [Enterovirga rhinocerotis]TDR90221.1 putative spermidine/putrescine transport system substrate-binding protein [Enterovirga rhinocerotis]